VYTLDTNSIIYYLNDDVSASPRVRDVLVEDRPVYISAITAIELLAFPQLTERELQKIEELLKTVSVIAVDILIARMAGALRQTYRLSIADSAIAATALFTGSVLLTRNVRDFKKVPQLKVERV
jgi:predicted nucleic acid-binding protein